jgi:hypothetical protein
MRLAQRCVQAASDGQCRMGSVLVVTQARRVKPLPAPYPCGGGPPLGRPLFVFDKLSRLFLVGRDRR